MQPSNDRDRECQEARYRERLSSEARLGLGLEIHRWHQNIVAPDGNAVARVAMHSPRRAAKTKTSRTLF